MGEQGCRIIDSMGKYIPREKQMILDSKALIKEPGKTGEEKAKGKVQKPRLKHRPDGTRHIEPTGWTGEEPGVGFVLPRSLNPNPGKTSVLHFCLQALWDTFGNKSLAGIVGQFNLKPIFKYKGLENYVSGECLYRDKCEFNTGDCACIWRPFQLLTWGRVKDDKFVPLNEKEQIRSPYLTMYELRDRVKKLMSPGAWLAYRDKLSKKYVGLIPNGSTEAEREEILERIGAMKIIDSLETMQRTDFNTANCYGIAFHQFGIALDRRYGDDLDTLCVCLALNARDPVKESKREAVARLEKKEQKEQVVPKKPKIKREPKPKFEEITQEESPEIVDDEDFDVVDEELNAIEDELEELYLDDDE